MKVNERHDKIMNLLQGRGSASVEELSELCARSVETIRRDLNELAKNGRIQKIHGGAKMPPMRSENHLSRRLQVNAVGKRAIGRALAEKVSAGDTLFMDTGSTTYYCAEALMDKKSICVITNSVDIAEMLGNNLNIQVIVIGGTYYADNRQLLGSLAVRDIGFYRPDYAVITVGGLDETGIMDFNISEATVAEAMIKHSVRTIVVADHLKLGKSCAFKVAGLDTVSELITDEEPSLGLVQALQQNRVDVCLADGNVRV